MRPDRAVTLTNSGDDYVCATWGRSGGMGPGLRLRHSGRAWSPPDLRRHAAVRRSANGCRGRVDWSWTRCPCAQHKAVAALSLSQAGEQIGCREPGELGCMSVHQGASRIHADQSGPRGHGAEQPDATAAELMDRLIRGDGARRVRQWRPNSWCMLQKTGRSVGVN